MKQHDDPDYLFVPLFEVLAAIGFGEHEREHHFDTGTLFWSLTRLFGNYERIMSVIGLERGRRPYLEADLENFIIRFRIVLNDVAYVIWQLFPPHTQGLKPPKGGTHPKNKEMSIVHLSEFLAKNTVNYPELASAVGDAIKWMVILKNHRDNVVHYKSRVVVFERETPHFAFRNAAGTELSVSMPNGDEGLALLPVVDFVNGQMLSLHRFMHEHLAAAVTAHANRIGFKVVPIGWDRRMSCPGIRSFRKANNLG